MAYLDTMGARAHITCAPYQADDADKGAKIIRLVGSNAVVYANTVLGGAQLSTGLTSIFSYALTGRRARSGVYSGRKPLAQLDLN